MAQEPQGLGKTLSDLKKIGKGVVVGETFDLAGAPADLADAFFSIRKSLFPGSDLGEAKAAEELAKGIGSEALIKKAGVDIPEFGFNLESAGRVAAPGLLLTKGAAGVKLLSKLMDGGPPSSSFAMAGIDGGSIPPVPRTSAEILMSENANLPAIIKPKYDPGKKYLPKEEVDYQASLAVGADESQQKEIFSPLVLEINQIMGKKPKRADEILDALKARDKKARIGFDGGDLVESGLRDYLEQFPDKMLNKEDLLKVHRQFKQNVKTDVILKTSPNASGTSFYEGTQRIPNAQKTQRDFGVMIFSDPNEKKMADKVSPDFMIKDDKEMKGTRSHDYYDNKSPGYFGHVRFSIQTREDGKKFLMLEEIQSDLIRRKEDLRKGQTTNREYGATVANPKPVTRKDRDFNILTMDEKMRLEKLSDIDKQQDFSIADFFDMRLEQQKKVDVAGDELNLATSEKISNKDSLDAATEGIVYLEKRANEESAALRQFKELIPDLETLFGNQEMGQPASWDSWSTKLKRGMNDYTELRDRFNIGASPERQRAFVDTVRDRTRISPNTTEEIMTLNIGELAEPLSKFGKKNYLAFDNMEDMSDFKLIENYDDGTFNFFEKFEVLKDAAEDFNSMEGVNKVYKQMANILKNETLNKKALDYMDRQFPIDLMNDPKFQKVIDQLDFDDIKARVEGNLFETQGETLLADLLEINNVPLDKIASKLVDEVTQEIGFIPQFDRSTFQVQQRYEKAYREMSPENFANLKREKAIKDISNRASEYYYGVEADAFKGAQEGALDKLQEAFNKSEKIASSKKKVFDDALVKLNEDFTPEKAEQEIKALANLSNDPKLKETAERFSDHIQGINPYSHNAPFRDMNQFSKFAFRSAIAEAKKLGLDGVVMPNKADFDAARGGAEVGKGTYSTNPKKVMDELAKEGVNISTQDFITKVANPGSGIDTAKIGNEPMTFIDLGTGTKGEEVAKRSRTLYKTGGQVDLRKAG